jgi:hypothetical protein
MLVATFTGQSILSADDAAALLAMRMLAKIPITIKIWGRIDFRMNCHVVRGKYQLAEIAYSLCPGV